MPDQSPVGARMSYWLADALVDVRKAAGVDKVDIAMILGAHEHTIKRLEDGQSMGRDVDRAVSAYADLADLDGREVWWTALYYWYERGIAPQFTAEGPPAAYAEALRAASLRLRGDGGGRSRTPTSIPAPPWLQDHRRRSVQ